jgi:hypothetical protein
MISFILWSFAIISIGLLGYHLVTLVIEIISAIGEGIMGDNGGIFIWIILIAGGIVMLLL